MTFVDYVALAFLCAVLIWRIVLPGMRSGKGSTPVPPPAVPTAGGGRADKIICWLKSTVGWMTVVLVVVGIAIFYFGIYSLSSNSPSLASTVAWARAHWLAVLALSAILYALITIFAKAMKEVGEGLGWMLTAALFMLYVGFPIWVALVEPSSAPTAPTASASAPATASTSASAPKAQMLTMEAGGKSERVRVPFQKRVLMHGRDFRYHCLYGDGHEESFLPGDGHTCTKGDMPYVFATNIRYDLPNVVTYSYEE
ncbi:MAG: hypothetical protein WA053_00925 [Minisyncoccia bacterium]